MSGTTKLPEHIEKLRDEALFVIFKSKEYYKLRCEYLEKYIDKTYSEQERDNCYMLWDILRRRYN